MIAAAILMAIMIFLFVITIGKSIIDGNLSRRRKLKDRIFESASVTENRALGNLRRQQRYSDIEPLQEIFAKQAFSEELALIFKRSGYKISLSAFFLLHISIGSVAFMIINFYLPLLPSAGLAALCLYFPFFLLRKKSREYVEKFSEHLPDATAIISNALKTGQSIERALENVGRNAPFPVSVEFQVLAGELKLGLPIEEALKNLYKRIKTPELKVFITGISIQQELGGNLSEIMENLEKTIRERYALQREIKVLSAQGIMSMWVLFCLPFAFAGVWAIADRSILTEYVTSSFGARLITFSVFIQMIAFVWMRKVVRIE